MADPMGAIRRDPANPWLAPFVFRGTVRRRFATPILPSPNPERVVSVTVGEAYRWPESVRLFTGEDVTVELSGEDLDRGAEAIFLAFGRYFGEGLALAEVGRMGTREGPSVERRLREAEEAAWNAAVLERLRKAALVVSGRVTQVHPAPPEKQLRVLTEHDPEWHEAVLEVESTVLGKLDEGAVVVNFSASYDEAWMDSPKLSEGQSGVFILQRDQQERGWAMMRIPGYSALDPLDVHSLELLPQLRSSIRRLSR